MAVATMTAKSGTEARGGPDEGDPRIAAFCSTRMDGLFHAFAYANDIWRLDPFDVGTIHTDARETFQRIVGRVRETSGLPTGRILLLLGESGCGKTHLMRLPQPGPRPRLGILRLSPDDRVHRPVRPICAQQPR